MDYSRFLSSAALGYHESAIRKTGALAARIPDLISFAAGAPAADMFPWAALQSLTRERDLHATLASVHRVLARGGLFGIDLVPDLPRWSEYRGRVSLEGRAEGGRTLTLVESVRQDRRRRLTIFDQTYIERRGREERRHRFSLTFRTLSVPQMARRLERAGFAVEAVLGDYQGGPWDERADTWVVLARRRP